jgi:hypothetical protein
MLDVFSLQKSNFEQPHLILKGGLQELVSGIVGIKQAL